MIIFALLALGSGIDVPARTGDQIGVATMLANRSVRYQLRSVECDGTIVHGDFVVRPDEARYEHMISALGSIEPGQTKPVLASPAEPCPTR